MTWGPNLAFLYKFPGISYDSTQYVQPTAGHKNLFSINTISYLFDSDNWNSYYTMCIGYLISLSVLRFYSISL
jgi:hypothetical protein